MSSTGGGSGGASVLQALSAAVDLDPRRVLLRHLRQLEAERQAELAIFDQMLERLPEELVRRIVCMAVRRPVCLVRIAWQAQLRTVARQEVYSLYNRQQGRLVTAMLESEQQAERPLPSPQPATPSSPRSSTAALAAKAPQSFCPPAPLPLPAGCPAALRRVLQRPLGARPAVPAADLCRHGLAGAPRHGGAHALLRRAAGFAPAAQPPARLMPGLAGPPQAVRRQPGERRAGPQHGGRAGGCAGGARPGAAPLLPAAGAGGGPGWAGV